MPRYDLTGRTVALTGSTGGLGNALASALRARGANLALLDLDGDATQAQAGTLGDATVARGWPADVRDLVALQQVVADGENQVAKEGGGVHEDARWDSNEMALDGVSADIIARTLREGRQRAYKPKGGWTVGR